MVNESTLIGRLGKNPELKKTNNGKAWCNFTIATSENYTKDGQKIEKTQWHNIVVWEKQAETAAQFLQKGSMAFVQGKLESRKYTDKNGVEREIYEVIARNIRFLTPKSKEDATSSAAGESFTPASEDFGDIPF